MKFIKVLFALAFFGSCFTSCERLIEIDPPKSSLVTETIFQSDDVATSAITGIYRELAETSGSFASGGYNSISSLSGASADEFIGFNSDIVEFYENQVSPSNSSNSSALYVKPFRAIYTANAVLEGLSGSVGVTPPVKNQLKGEALFIRAFCYFYLVNMFGPVPLQLTTDYRVTQVASRAPVAQVYQQVLADLKIAEELLGSDYITSERIRPNKFTVQALLARVYLYLQDWVSAEKYSTSVIDNISTYSLVSLDGIFLKNSKEAIWQLMPSANTNSGDGNLFILTNTQSQPINVSLRNDFVNSAFEPVDKRKQSWIRSYSTATGTYYYPYKYKVKSSTTVTEYSMVFRLSEQYLIRAEARINQNKISLGISDLNTIRQRVVGGVSTNSLPLLSANMPIESALTCVEKERRVELFSEWGHRWFDLKRTKRAEMILMSIKPKLKSTGLLYPIPIREINLNPNILQNSGY